MIFLQMAKDIKQLPKDFRKLVTEARAEAAQEIQQSLMNRSPFGQELLPNPGSSVKLKYKQQDQDRASLYRKMTLHLDYQAIYLESQAEKELKYTKH